MGDAAGRILARRRQPTRASGDPARDLADWLGAARALVSQAGAQPDEIAAVGLSLPGPLDRAAGRVLDPPNLPGWGHVDVRKPFAEVFRAPIALENDANAAALAEWRHGAGRGTRDLVYLTMSTGIGGGLILGGRLHRGVDSFAGELGHVRIVWEEGALCGCGRRGCLEAYAGGANWARRLAAEAPEDSRVRELGGVTPRPEHVVAAAEAGDAFALAELDRFNTFVARAIANLFFAVAPEVVVLGTIAVGAGEALCFQPLRAKVAELLAPVPADRLRIAPAELGEELPYRAALAAAETALDPDATEG
ncbi:MAG: ROK family protein [Proteobacteria bacterium]|nr:ROK family protein [Pseudomonadota bacterium]